MVDVAPFQQNQGLRADFKGCTKDVARTFHFTMSYY